MTKETLPRFRVELDRLRREFQDLQEEHQKAPTAPESEQRHLDRLRRWIAHVEVFRRKYLVIRPEPELSEQAH